MGRYAVAIRPFSYGPLRCVRPEGYNLLNHPNLVNPLPQEGAYLGSSNFRVLSRMGNSGLGGTANVYSSGGPRNIQFALRLEF